MKLIGIVGKSGAGKTTFARMLKRDQNIGIINLDEVSNFRKIKEKMPRSMVEQDVYINNLGEEYIAFSSKMLGFLYKIKNDKFLSKMYRHIVDSIINIGIRREIEKNNRNGKNVIIVERCNIRKSFCV